MCCGCTSSILGHLCMLEDCTNLCTISALVCTLGRRCVPNCTCMSAEPMAHEHEDAAQGWLALPSPGLLLQEQQGSDEGYLPVERSSAPPSSSSGTAWQLFEPLSIHHTRRIVSKTGLCSTSLLPADCSLRGCVRHCSHQCGDGACRGDTAEGAGRPATLFLAAPSHVLIESHQLDVGMSSRQPLML